MELRQMLLSKDGISKTSKEKFYPPLKTLKYQNKQIG
jgi:hypothetical protein